MLTRKILFSRIALDARIGILDHEKLAPQPIHVDAELDVEVRQQTNDTDIGTVLDYREIHDLIVRECTGKHTNLLETLTECIGQELLAAFPEVTQARVRVSKLNAFSDAAGVAIEITIDRQPD